MTKIIVMAQAKRNYIEAELVEVLVPQRLFYNTSISFKICNNREIMNSRKEKKTFKEEKWGKIEEDKKERMIEKYCKSSRKRRAELQKEGERKSQESNTSKFMHTDVLTTYTFMHICLQIFFLLMCSMFNRDGSLLIQNTGPV